MSYLFINQVTKINTKDNSLPITDSYADAILRTFASLTPSSSSKLSISRKSRRSHQFLSTLINRSLDNQHIEAESSSSSSSSSSINENQLTLEVHLPLASNKSKQLKKFHRLLSRLDKIYNKKEMSTKTLLPSSSHINDRYFFHSHSNIPNNTRLSTKTKLNDISSPNKRYKFSSTNTEQYDDKIYNFSTNQTEQRSHSSDSNRYYFPSDSSIKNSQHTLKYLRSGSGLEQRSMAFIEGGTPTSMSDTPYLFSKTTETQQYPSTISTFIHPDDTWIYQRHQPQQMFTSATDYPLRASSMSSGYRQQTRMDTVTSTNGSLSPLKQSPTVHFEPSCISNTERSYLNEARKRLSGKRRMQSPESFEKSVDRLILSVNKKYGQPQQQQMPSPSSSSSFNYISQYYAKEEEPSIDYSIENDNNQQRLYYNLNTNRIHTQIMKTVNKSLLDRNYQTDKNRLKHLEQNVRRCLRLYENQSLHRELNYNLIRCFSSSYLGDLRREEIRQVQTRNHMRSYTYEDIQDINVPSILEAYKMKTAIDREKHHRLQSSNNTGGQLSPATSSGYSPIMVGSLNENIDTQSGAFETDQRSYASICQTPANIRLSVDVFYEIMQASFRGIDASIAGHVSKASQYTKQKSNQSHTKTRDYDSDVDIKSNSSFWSDEEDDQHHIEEIHQRKTIPHQRKLSRYLSTVNRSLLDRPSDLIADFYLSQLNRNMQESVRNVEIISRDKAYKQEFLHHRQINLIRSLSAEHLYQVRKEHLRYKQPFITPTSFTTEDVADIYKPSVLENYKRKIAIELERRRRQRQGLFTSGPYSPNIYTSEIDLINNVIKTSHPPIIDHHRQDFSVVSSPTVVETKEIIMGRARQTLTDDGSDMLVHHVGTTFPPSIYSDVKQLSPQRRITFTATINEQNDIPYVTDVDSLDFIDTNQMHIRQEQEHNDEIIDGTLNASKQIITSHRPQTKLYTHIRPIKPVQICRADRIESKSDNHYLSIVNINQSIPPIPLDNYLRATIMTSPEQLLSLADQSCNEQVIQYIEQQPKYEHSTLIVPVDEHIAKIQEDIPIFEVVQTTNLSIPATCNVKEVSDDSDMCLYTPQINEQPVILNSSHVNQLERLYEKYVGKNQVQFNEELNQLEEIENIEEQLPEIEKTTVQMEVTYVTSYIQLPVNHPLNELDPLASLLEELNTSVQPQHATQIIDDNHYWKTYEKVEESVRMPIIVYDTEWKNEQVQIIPNLKNVQHKYPETIIEYEQAKLNLSHEFTNKLCPISFEIQPIIDNDEKILSLSDDSYVIRHQQQSNIHIDQPPDLENPLHSTDILTLNYAHYNRKHSQENKSKHPGNLSSSISSNHIDSQTSSFVDMEIFLNHFEESLDHEQHLPLIDQISLSYATSFTGQYQPKPRTLPIEWFQPTILSHDEQLVEQWTVVKDIDTIQQEGTLRLQQLEILTKTDTFHTNEKVEEQKSNSSTLIDEQENTHIIDVVSHYSSTSDYSTDSVDNDNDINTCITNSAVIIPAPMANSLPSSSITTTTLLSQSSPPVTSYSVPIVPIVYFLDALAIEQNETNNLAKDFLLTIGFGQNQINKNMNEITNTISTTDQPSRPTWINRPSSDDAAILPTVIHHEQQICLPLKLHFATENQLEEDDTALLIYSHRLQYGHDLGENTQEPLNTFFEPAHLHLPVINEVYIYQMSFHNEFPLFHPPDILPHILASKTHEDDILSSNEYQINQLKIFSFACICDLADNEEHIQAIALKFDQPAYIEHCHIQPLYSFSEICYAQINQPEILSKNDMDFLSNILQTKPIKYQDEYELNQYDIMEPMQQNTGSNQIEHVYGKLHLPISTITTTEGVRPPAPTETGPIYENLSMEKNVDVDMGTNGQYKQDDSILVPETIIEHISEDEKSTSSEEVIFEEWSEEFRCRRTDEYDRNTNKLIRSRIDETSERVKGDVIKEEYKEKNVRLKGHKSYNVIKQVQRRVPASKLVPPHPHEEIPQPPPLTKVPTTISSSHEHQQSLEELYTSEILHDSNLTKTIKSTYDRVRPGGYSPIPAPTQAAVTRTPSTHYSRISEVVTPTLHYADQRKQEREDFVNEEYHIEIETKKSQEDKPENFVTTVQSPLTRRKADWRNELKQLYTSTSTIDRSEQYRQPINGNSIPQQRVKEVQIKISAHNETPPQQRRLGSSSSPSRHNFDEVLVRISRNSSPEKHYHHSFNYEYQQEKENFISVDFETSEKIISKSPTNDDRSQPPKRSSSSSSILDERRTQYNQTDRPSLSRVGILRNAFESTTNGSIKGDTSKYKTSGLTSSTEQTNKESTRRPINQYQSVEPRTESSFVAERKSRFESSGLQSPVRAQSSERLGRTGFDTIKSSLESSIAKSTPQTSLDIRVNNKQVISSIDSDFGGPSQPIYQSTPKSIKQQHDEDAGHETEDELSDSKQTYGTRHHTSTTHLRDFSQSTSPTLDTTHLIERTPSRFDETNIENIHSHLPTSRGKNVLIELTPSASQSPTRSIYERNKSNITPDSGVFDYTAATSHHLRTSSPAWRNNVSTSVDDITTHSHDNSVYINSTGSGVGSPYTRRKISNPDQTIQGIDDSISRSTYRYDTEIPSSEPINQQQRTVRRQITSSSPIDYRHGLDTQGKVPITTQSRSIKPFVVDEIETIETETRVECQVQRTCETNESTKTDRTASPTVIPKKTLTTITSHSTHNLSEEKPPPKRVFIRERPQYYEPTNRSSIQDKEIEHNHSLRSNIQTYTTDPHPLKVTSLSSETQIKFDRKAPNEIIATVRIPEFSNGTTTSSSTIHHGINDSELFEKTKSEEERYQRGHATSYHPSPILHNYQQQQTRSRIGSTGTTNNYSSPINFPVRPASHHSSVHEQQQPQRSYSPDSGLTLRSRTHCHSRSLDNLFGSNLDFEIEIEKRPPQQPEQPTVVSLDQNSRATVTTSKDGRVSIQNIAVRPGNTVVINSDFHSSDRSLNRSSGYFSSDEIRSQGHNTTYSSDEQSSGANPNSFSVSSRTPFYQPNERTYHFDQVNDIVHHYSQPSINALGFNDAIDQIDALYNNLDIEINERPYDFSQPTSTTNRRKQLAKNSAEYASRYTSTGFQHVPYEHPTTSALYDTSKNQNWSPSSLTNLDMGIPARSSQPLSDYGISGSTSPSFGYGSVQNLITHQNRLNGQSQIVQRNRTSVKQVKQKNAARKRNGNTQEQYSDGDDDNDSPLSDNGILQPRSRPSSRSYNFNNHRNYN